MGDAAKKAVPNLTALAEKHKDDMVRYNAKQVLDRIQAKPIDKAPPVKPNP